MHSQATGVTNAMTVDVEDYFQVSAFDDVVGRHQWDRLESRVCANTDRLLRMFADHRVRATFFVLGWVAERFPALIRRIAAAGHELASHGYSHRLIYAMTPEEFRADVRRSRYAIESAASMPVLGYRAPSYSVTAASLWALDILIEEGFVYDASVFPIHHDRYGLPSAPRHPHTVRRPGGTLLEVPGSTIRCGAVNLPIGGGGYFRMLPYAWTSFGIRRLNLVERKPAVFYVHPWEIDPAQPRFAAPWLSRLRHYRNLHRTESRLRRLLAEFRFDTVSAAVGLAAVRAGAA